MSAELAPIVERLAVLRDDNRRRMLAAPMDEEIEAALVALSGPEAPVEFQQIARRVGEGSYSWHEFFADPGVEGRVGHLLVHQVTREVAARIARTRGEPGPGTEPRDEGPAVLR